MPVTTGALSSIGKKLSRLFLGRITVHDLLKETRTHDVSVMTHTRDLETYPVRSHPRVSAAMFMEWKESKARTAGDILGSRLEDNIKITSVSMDDLAQSKVRQYKLRFLDCCRARHGTKMIKKLPQLRRNRLNFLKNPPRFARSSLIAFFSPIFQGCVKKSSLDKATGRLMLWYDEHKIASGKSHLMLFRVFEGKEPLRWVWLDVDAKNR